ncbi:cwfJ-like family protein [Artemisia annua]|uniref:CwfJ-like family protein n=1 Tax=Artemisia annua TaxID=35608 RepID=A0A2U1NAE4_ARTAN|nr:cwfJ-like family protein [Artemisia annua]
MLSGLKFIPRDQLDDNTQDDKLDSRKTHKKKKKKNKSRHDGSSDEDGSQRIKKRSKKKWYSSEEDDDSDSYSDSGSDDDTRKGKESKKRHKSKISRRRGKTKRRGYSSDESDDDDDDKKKKGKKRSDKSDTDGNSCSVNDNENIVRKEMGLEWMLRPKEEDVKQKSVPASHLPEEPPADEIKKVNPRELNPYFRNDGSGYPEEEGDGAKFRDSNLLSTSVVGDGGASWRLKAMKRSQEQAAREGKNLDEVVKERWGSLGKLAVSVASNSAAPSHAHLHAIKNRIRQQNRDQPGGQNETERDDSQKGMHAKMRVPRRDESLSWGKRRGQSMSVKDAGVISSALSSLQKFSNDGSFLHQFKGSQQQKNDDSSSGDRRDSKSEEPSSRTDGGDRREVSKSEEPSSRADMKPALSANQLAAKVMQLRMKGKHAEADKLLKEAEVNEGKSKTDTIESNPQGDGTASRYIMHGLKSREKNREEDADMHVARSIMQNKKFSISGQADDEYDNDEGPKRKKRGKGDNNAAPKPARFEKRILTQQERCNFCFENPKRPRHLVIAIANFTYMMLPQWQPVVPGHCCILPMQHDLATRSVDDNVWDEIRNFKKCLLMMFAKQEKEVVFLETVMGLAKQSRHCMIECIPLPPEVAKQAPLYFKKAIDEAESEWSQHNAKKLIDTSEKGLRHSIPPDFPYFHVEFGLKKGYVHVIDDESQFKSSFGVNVVRGMLRLPAEDMHRRHQRDSLDSQKQAVADFRRDWDSFDWTKQLD